MKCNSLRTAAVCLAAGAVVWTWILLRMEPDSGSRGRAKAASILELMVPPAPVPVVWPKPGSSEFKNLALVRTRSWLNARGRDAAGLIAVWDLTRDGALLKEATERFPDDPVVCLAMITSDPHRRRQDALPWIERLLAIEPKNPQGWFLKAWALSGNTTIGGSANPYFVHTDRDGVLAALREGVTLGTERDAYGQERALAVREAALAAGMSATDAAFLSTGDHMRSSPIGDPLDRLGADIVWHGIANIFRNEIMRARQAGDSAAMVELAELGLAVEKAGCRAVGPVTLNELQRVLWTAQELQAELPGDLVLSDGRSVTEAVSADLRPLEISYATAMQNRIYAEERCQKASDEIAQAYNQRLLAEGEPAAIMWIMAQPRSAWPMPLWREDAMTSAEQKRRQP